MKSMKRCNHALLIAGLSLFLAFSPAAQALEPVTNALFVRVIDVGAGHAAVIKTPQGKFLIYDAGNKAPAMAQIKKLIPQGSDIELMVLSHSDADHLGAAKDICTRYNVKRIIHSGLRKPTIVWKNTMRAIKAEVMQGCIDMNLSKNPIAPGTQFNLGIAKAVIVFGLSEPPDEWGFVNQSGEFFNSGSIVMKLECFGKAVLFTGDTVGRLRDDDENACIAAENFMVMNAPSVSIKADVMIAPHHGADNGSSIDFIKAVKPTFVLFPAGHKYKHPKNVTAQRYLSNGVLLANIFRTDLEDDEEEPDDNSEWTHGRRILTFKDEPGDDDVDILIKQGQAIKVEYRNQ